MGSEPKRTSLLICDDHRLLTDALSMLVEQTDSIRLIAPAAHDPEDAVSLCTHLHPDVVLMDLHFENGMSGIEGTRRIKQVSPDTKVVVMTAHHENRLMAEAIEAGASGFLSKTEAIADVLSAVTAAAQGEVLIDPARLTSLLREVAKRRTEQTEVTQRFSKLTNRESEILQLLVEGTRNDEIASRLHITSQTVQTHVRNLLSKLDVHSKLEAVALAVKSGAVSV